MKKLIQAVLLSATFASPSLIQAAEFPNAPVKLIVSAGAGGAPDIVARLLAEKMKDNLQGPVVVDNRAGASGLIATNATLGLPADGYTVLVGTSGMVQIPHLMESAKYDINKEFVPILHIGGAPLAMLVNSKLPATTIKEFVAYAKKQPARTINYGSYGVATLSHIYGVMLSDALDVEMTHVSYKTAPSALMDLVAERVQISFQPIDAALPHIASGKLRVLAMAGTTRSTRAPEVPTFGESGVAGLDLQPWMALFVRSGTPDEARKRLTIAAEAALRNPDTTKRMNELGMLVGDKSPPQMTEQIKSDLERYRDIFKKNDIKLN